MRIYKNCRYERCDYNQFLDQAFGASGPIGTRRGACFNNLQQRLSFMPHFQLNRRSLLRAFGLGTMAQLPALVGAMSTVSPAVAQGLAADAAPFDGDSVLERARTLAKKPYKSRPVTLPPAIANLSPERQATIQAKPNALVWTEENLTFVVEPIHRTRQTPGQMTVFLVENGASRHLKFSRDLFVYPGGPPDLPENTGLAGFRILERNENNALTAVGQFYAPDIYQAIGRNQMFGLAARPLSIRTRDGAAEEPAEIVAVWIEKPLPGQRELVVHAVFNAVPVTGALRFTFRPGTATVVDTECTLFARVDVTDFGVGTMAATHLSGTLDTRFADDVRPAVHDTNGLQIRTGSNEWIFRPVSNGQRLQISGFVDKNPSGFGFVQRDRRFESYLDGAMQWQRRPSLWIEPLGKWGDGQVTLLEIPSTSENNKNIICYWQPGEGLKAGSQKRYVFRQFWGWTPPDKPELAMVTLTRQGRPPSRKKNQRRFLVHFTGDGLFPKGARPVFTARASAGKGKIINVQILPVRTDGLVQVTVDLESGNAPYVELRMHLEVEHKRVSEAWLSRWSL
jgi:periplasmic glucans biosynthesis protein